MAIEFGFDLASAPVRTVNGTEAVVVAPPRPLPGRILALDAT
jgi:hypothetical protein